MPVGVNTRVRFEIYHSSRLSPVIDVLVRTYINIFYNDRRRAHQVPPPFRPCFDVCLFLKQLAIIKFPRKRGLFSTVEVNRMKRLRLRATMAGAGPKIAHEPAAPVLEFETFVEGGGCGELLPSENVLSGC